MWLKSRLAENRFAGMVSALFTSLAGLFLLIYPGGGGLMRLSYDLPFLFCPEAKTDEVVIIKMDEEAYDRLGQTYGRTPWDRSLHARLIKQLLADGARLIVFDVFFVETNSPAAADKELAEAIAAHGKVVLAASRESFSLEGVVGGRTYRPLPVFLEAGGNRLGISRVLPDGAYVRTHSPEIPEDPSLPWAAAKLYGATVTKDPEQRFARRWLRYYGPASTVPSVSYNFALDKPPGWFRDKVVFIGGKPSTDFVGSVSDQFGTPFTRWDRRFTPGVEIEATMFLNLIRGDWLTQMPPLSEFLLVLFAGLLCGYAFCLTRPLPGAGWAAFLAVVISAAAILVFWKQRIWFDWVLIAGVQVPVAWATCAVLYTKKLLREKETLKREIETARFIKGLAAATPAPASAVFLGESRSRSSLPLLSDDEGPSLIAIRDFKLLQKIGAGSYGEVWLARSLTGAYRAIKIVHRKRLPEDRLFDREFTGVQQFEPISRGHPGWVAILHVGMGDNARYFYYVMEAADDTVGGQEIEPGRYMPKTLSSLLTDRGRLPLDEAIQLGVDLARALGALHQRNLIHRDIKPSNIIYVRNIPKLADIGLVTQIDRSVSRVGTEFYIAPEGPGTAKADIYSLGKVIYQAATGSDAADYPGLPSSLGSRSDARELMKLMEVINKACEKDPRWRYDSGEELSLDLESLRSNLYAKYDK